MKSFKFKQLSNNERGSAIVEFGVLVALITVVALPMLTEMGLSVADRFCDSGVKVIDAGRNTSRQGYYSIADGECCTTAGIPPIQTVVCGNNISS